MLVLHLLSLAMTASCTEAPVPDADALLLTGIRDHDKEIGNTTGTVLGQDADSVRYITLSLDNREVQIRIVPDERERWKVPCTYVLDNGEVIHHNCEGLYHTPHNGKGRWKISEVRAGLIRIERYRDSTSYRPGPFMPEVVLGKEPMPYRLEYFSPDYSRHLRTVELYASNPYTKEKMPQIEIEQFYEGEMGFGYPAPGDETAWLWTYSGVFFFDNGYTGITYRLFRQNANRALLGITTTIFILDSTGRQIFKMPDVDLDIVPVMVTKDGKYLGTQLNTLIDVQEYPRRLGMPGIRIHNIHSGEVVFEDIDSAGTGYFQGPFQKASHLVFYSRRENLYDDSRTTYIFLDIELRKKYIGTFTKEQINSGIVSWSSTWEKIVESEYFTPTKF